MNEFGNETRLDLQEEAERLGYDVQVYTTGLLLGGLLRDITAEDGDVEIVAWLRVKVRKRD